ncbi:ABC transporter ATP-binding protein [Catenulispora yoronensis]|uniref:ABC transporter ATP-binding protein n=1 Tax=Catenulispora yoronensis TaxID=450799 RepID=A0ABP5GZV5_9ACTN
MTAAGSTLPPLLELRDVRVAFGGLTALDGVSLSVPRGRVVGVIGPAGAGKTTMLDVVCGRVRPTSGEVLVRGISLHGHRPQQLASLGVARTLQRLGLFSHLTVAENVMAGAVRMPRAGFLPTLLALPRADRRERALRARALAVLDRVGLADTADLLPGRLSHGDQKRVVLARALIAEPSLLLLDEPAAGLSAAEMSELSAQLATLRAADALSVMLVEHRVDFAMGLCDDVVVLDSGRLIAQGPPAVVALGAFDADGDGDGGGGGEAGDADGDEVAHV